MKQEGRKNISTVKQIEALKPRADRFEIPDATIRGLRLVVFPTGKMSWAYRYRFGGRTRKLTLDCGATDLARARKLAGDAMNKVAAHVDPGIEKQEKKQAGSPLTVAGLIDRYAAEHLGKTKDEAGVVSYALRSGYETERVLKKELKPYANRLADGGISSHEAVTIIKDVAERGTVMRNRTLTALKTLFVFAMSAEVKAASSSPFAGLELREEASRERVLSKAELRAVWQAAEKLGHPYTAIIRLLVLTGQRLHEIADLRWNEIDFVERQIILPGSRTKNGESHIVALSDTAIEILKAYPKIKSDDGLVFTATGRPLNGWSKLRARLNEAVAEALERKPERWT